MTKSVLVVWRHSLAPLALLVLACTGSQAQVGGNLNGGGGSGVKVQGVVNAGDCPQFVDNKTIQSTGAPCGGSSSVAGNPTATIGATAVNGVASTYMRSDAAPPLPATLPALNGSNLTVLNASNLGSGTVPAARGGAGTVNGILKANGSGAVSQATSGTDYAPATSGSAVLKGNGSGGFSNAAAGTDFAPATSGSAILKGNGSGGFSNAASGTDYAPATSGNSLLYGNGSGGFSNATVGTGLSFTGGTLSATGGGGGVSSVTGNNGINCTPTTGSVVCSPTNGFGNSGAAITGTTYTVDCTPNTGDGGKVLLFTGSSALAITLNAPTGNCSNGFGTVVNNRGSATITITASGNINGSATKTLTAGQSAVVYSNPGSSTWFSEDGAAAGGGSGTVNSGTAGQMAYYAGSGTAVSGSNLGTGVLTALGNNLSAAGGLTSTIARGTASMGTSAIASGACATVVTVSATNVATTDIITAGFNGDPTGVTGYAPSASGMLTIIAYPSANNVNFKVCNNTGGSITPGSLTLNWSVNR